MINDQEYLNISQNNFKHDKEIDVFKAVFNMFMLRTVFLITKGNKFLKLKTFNFQEFQ